MTLFSSIFRYSLFGLFFLQFFIKKGRNCRNRLWHSVASNCFLWSTTMMTVTAMATKTAILNHDFRQQWKSKMPSSKIPLLFWSLAMVWMMFNKRISAFTFPKHIQTDGLWAMWPTHDGHKGVSVVLLTLNKILVVVPQSSPPSLQICSIDLKSHSMKS